MLTVEKALILGAAALFEGLGGESLTELAAIAEEVEVEAGETIVQQGQFSSCLYVVASGQVSIRRDGEEIVRLGESRIFGVRESLDPCERKTQAVALEDGLLFRFEHEALLELLTEDVDLAKGIIRYLCRRLD